MNVNRTLASALFAALTLAALCTPARAGLFTPTDSSWPHAGPFYRSYHYFFGRRAYQSMPGAHPAPQAGWVRQSPGVYPAPQAGWVRQSPGVYPLPTGQPVAGFQTAEPPLAGPAPSQGR